MAAAGVRLQWLLVARKHSVENFEWLQPQSVSRSNLPNQLWLRNSQRPESVFPFTALIKTQGFRHQAGWVRCSPATKRFRAGPVKGWGKPILRWVSQLPTAKIGGVMMNEFPSTPSFQAHQKIVSLWGVIRPSIGTVAIKWHRNILGGLPG